jgi:diaminopimelate decarboxylase
MLQQKNDTFHIGNVPTSLLYKKFGSPTYVYDAQTIQQKYQTLVNGFANVASLRINYAVKALTNISVLKYLRSLGSCVDTVSLEEIQICLKAGFLPAQIGYTPSGVPFAEIEKAVQLGVQIHLDSIPLMQQFGKKYGNQIPVGLRINPHVLGGGNFKISTAHERSKFGISIEQIDEIVETIEKYKLHVDGLHQHTGSDIKEADTFVQSMQHILAIAFRFPNLRYVDLGGGFKVSYKKEEKEADIEKLGKTVASHFNEFCKKYGKPLELWFEPGKFLVSESGTLLTTATVVKDNPSLSFVHLDTGLNHLIRPMMYDAYHDIENISNPNGALKQYNIVGYICETDNFAEDRPLNEVRQGDKIAIRNAGAYGFMMASQYNSRVRPAEVLVLNETAHLIRKRETLKDILKNQIELDI